MQRRRCEEHTEIRRSLWLGVFFVCSYAHILICSYPLYSHMPMCSYGHMRPYALIPCAHIRICPYANTLLCTYPPLAICACAHIPICFHDYMPICTYAIWKGLNGLYCTNLEKRPEKYLEVQTCNSTLGWEGGVGRHRFGLVFRIPTQGTKWPNNRKRLHYTFFFFLL